MKRKVKKIFASVLSVFLVLTITFSSVGSITAQAWVAGRYNFKGTYVVFDKSTHTAITENVLNKVLVTKSGWTKAPIWGDYVKNKDEFNAINEPLLYGVNFPDLSDTYAGASVLSIMRDLFGMMSSVLSVIPEPTCKGIGTVGSVLVFFSNFLLGSIESIEEKNNKNLVKELTCVIDGREYASRIVYGEKVNKTTIKKALEFANKIGDILGYESTASTIVSKITGKELEAGELLNKLIKLSSSEEMWDFLDALITMCDYTNFNTTELKTILSNLKQIKLNQLTAEQVKLVSKSVNVLFDVLSLVADAAKLADDTLTILPHVRKEANHYYNANEDGSFLANEKYAKQYNAKVAYKREYEAAVICWKNNFVKTSLFHLGCCLHYIQDVCQPFHAMNIYYPEELSIFDGLNWVNIVSQIAAPGAINLIRVYGTFHKNFEKSVLNYVFGEKTWKITYNYIYDSKNQSQFITMKVNASTETILREASMRSINLFYKYLSSIDNVFPTELAEREALINAQIYTAATIRKFSNEYDVKNTKININVDNYSSSSSNSQQDYYTHPTNNPTPVAGTSFSSANFNGPGTLEYNTGFYNMKGTVYCTTNITSVTAGIKNSSGTVRSLTVRPNAKSYDITKSTSSGENALIYLAFKGLSPGQYTYYVTASSGSESVPIFSASFTVKKPSLTLTVDGAKSPSGSYESGFTSCEIGGTVRSVYAGVAGCSDQELTKVLVQVKDSSGAVVLSKEYTSSGTKSININNAVNIGSLTVTKYTKKQYTYTVTATTKGGVTKPVLSSTFAIEDTTPYPVSAPKLSFSVSQPALGTQANDKNVFYAAETGTLNVSWGAVQFGKYYTVRVYKDGIEIANKSGITGTSAGIALPKNADDYSNFGKYSVRVDAMNAKKNKSSTGNYSEFTILYPKPTAKLIVDVADAGTYTLFTVEGQFASSYAVKLFKIEKNKFGKETEVSYSDQYNLTPSQNKFKVRLAEGKYRAEVYAYNYKFGKDHVDNGEFSFKGEDVRFEVLRAQPEKVALNVRYRNLDNGLSGVVQTTSPFKQAVSGRVEFYWEPAIYAYSGYVVTIYKGNKVSDTVYRKLTSLSKNDLEVSAILPKGEYTAVLTAYNDSPKAANVRYTVSNPITFSIEGSTVKSLEIKDLGYKKVYGLDEVLSKKGLVVMANYENGESWPVTALCTFSTLDSSSAGKKVVTVTYNGVSTSFEVTVTDQLVNGKAYVSYDTNFLFTNKKLTELGLDKLYGLLYKDAFIYDSTAKTKITIYKPTNAKNYTINIYRGSAINDYDDVLLNSSLVKSASGSFDTSDYVYKTFTGLPVGRYVAEVICSNGLTGSDEIIDKSYVNFNILRNPWSKDLATNTVFLEYLDHENGVTTQFMQESGGSFNQMSNGTVRINWTKMANYICQVNIYQETENGRKLIISELSPNDYIDDMGISANFDGGIGLLNYSAIVGYSEYALAPGSYTVVLKAYNKSAKGISEYIAKGTPIPSTTQAEAVGNEFSFEIMPMDVKEDGLSIAEPPAKTEYAYGEKIDLYGLKLNAVMAETEETVTVATKDISVNGYNRYKPGEQEITLSYHGENVKMTVTVDEPAAGKIYPSVYQVQSDGSVWTDKDMQFTAYADKNMRIEWKPVENANSYTVYIFEGNKTNLNNMDGLYKTVFNDAVSEYGEENTKRYYTDIHLYAGEYTVYVAANNANDGRYITYADEGLHFNISGNSNVEFIYAEYLPSKEYNLGEGFDLSSVIVTAYLENGDTMDITDKCEYLGFSSDSIGSHSMNISYNDKFCTTLSYYVSDSVNDDILSGKSIITSITDKKLLNNNTVVCATISNNVKNISKEDINNCPNLMSVYIPNSVNTIESGSFSGCPVNLIYCQYGSAAYTYALNNGINYVIVSDNADVTASGKNVSELFSFENYIDKLIESMKGEEPEPCDPESVFVMYDTNTLYVGQSAEAYYDVLPYYSTVDDVVWSSSDENIATVDRNTGTVTAVSEGIVEITATVFGFENIQETVEFSILKPVASVEDGTIMVPAYSFADNQYITSIELPLSVSAIGSFAFTGCTGLNGEIRLHDGIEYIGAYAFSGCTQITKLYLPYGLSEIKEGIVSGCSSLNEIYIPETVTEIDIETFDGFWNDETQSYDIVILCEEDSYAYYFAEACGIVTCIINHDDNDGVNTTSTFKPDSVTETEFKNESDNTIAVFIANIILFIKKFFLHLFVK